MSTFSLKYAPEIVPKLLQALPTTLSILFIATTFGLILGIFLATVRLEKIPVLSQISAVAVSFLRGTPVLIQMFLVYFGAPALLEALGVRARDIFENQETEKLIYIYITYSLNMSAFFSEIIRSSVLAVPKSQWDAAASIGLKRSQIYIRIILPQSVRIAIPSFAMTMTGLLQDSALAFSLGILDVLGKAKTIGVVTGRVIESYIAAAVIFVALTIIFEQVFHLIEKKTAYNTLKEKQT